MYAYLNLLRQCRREGVRQKNRTGVDTFMIPGGMMSFDCGWRFPILTTKKVNFDAVKAELIGFIRGYTSAADFRRLGTRIWDANANDPAANGGKWHNSVYRKGTDDLGRIYGRQWRDWVSGYPMRQGPGIDQLEKAVRTILEDPTSRRIIVTAWNPAELDMMALPPCHLLFQLLVEQEKHRLHMTMYQRSCDMFLGVPFNISSYALLLWLISYATGYTPGQLTMFLADVHIYENHISQVDEQLERWPRPRPTLRIPDEALARMGLSDWISSLAPEQSSPLTAMEFLEKVLPEDINLEGYEPAAAIKAKMAV